MTETIKYILLVALTAVMAGASAATVPDSGLGIQAYPTPANRHTTLSLDGGQPIDFDGGSLRMTAKVWVRPENVLGTVFRIILDNGANVDLLYSVEKDMRYPMLVTGEDVQLQTVAPRADRWVDVAVTLSPKSGEVTLVYDGQKTEAAYPALRGARSARIDWGLCLIEGRKLLDVASVTVKDIRIERKGKTIRNWELRAHRGDTCYDAVASSPAVAVNPRWMVDETIKWKEIFSEFSESLPSVAFDPAVATFYMVKEGYDKLYVYHPSENVIDSIEVSEGHHAAAGPSRLIYLPETHSLVSYNISENLFSVFDPVKHTWSGTRRPDRDHDFWYSTVSYNPADTTLVSFGGYGHYRYNNLLIAADPLTGVRLKDMTLNSIDPRRSASTAIVDGKLYICGGWGCHSGRQELSAHAYYDMYRVDLTDYKEKTLWQFAKSPFGDEFTGLGNMIYDPEQKCFYMLTTLEGGVLLKVDPEDGSMEKVSMPMGLAIDDAHTFYGGLFYSAPQEKLYAVMIWSDVDESSQLHIYELPFPPAGVSAFTQPQPEKKSDLGRLKLLLPAGIVLAAVIFFAAAAARRKRRRAEILSPADDGLDSPAAHDTPPSSPAAPSGQDSPAPAAEPAEKERYVPETQTPEAIERSCIDFFGGFRVFDREGVEKTSSFSPILKNLLLILVFYSGQEAHGISNSRLINFLWRGKDETSAKNSLNVYLSKLRALLSGIGEVTVASEQGLRSLTFGSDVSCDYLEAERLLSTCDKGALEPLLDLLLRGSMLPNVELDYIDQFKSNFSNRVIEYLSAYIGDPSLTEETRLKVANALLIQDPINEDAMREKCVILHHHGRTGTAQTFYNSFCREYTALMGEPYPKSLRDTLKG